MRSASVSSTIFGLDVSAVRDLILPEVARGRVRMVEVYRVVGGGSGVEVVPYVDVVAPDLPQGSSRAVAEQPASHRAH